MKNIILFFNNDFILFEKLSNIFIKNFKGYRFYLFGGMIRDRLIEFIHGTKLRF